jgi:CBS domain-containing protein
MLNTTQDIQTQMRPTNTRPSVPSWPPCKWDLVVAPLDQPVREIMNSDVIDVYTETDQEEAARLIQRYDFIALPVVDSER